MNKEMIKENIFKMFESQVEEEIKRKEYENQKEKSKMNYFG